MHARTAMAAPARMPSGWSVAPCNATAASQGMSAGGTFGSLKMRRAWQFMCKKAMMKECGPLFCLLYSAAVRRVA